LQILPCLLRRITSRAERLTRLMAAYVDGLPRRIQTVLHHASRLVVLVDDRVRQITGGITRHFGHAPRALLEVAPGFLAGTGREQQRHARAKRHSDQEGADAGIPLLDDHVGFIAHFLVSPPHDSSPWGSLSAALSLARRPCLLHVLSPSRFAPPPSRSLRSRHSGRRVPPVPRGPRRNSSRASSPYVPCPLRSSTGYGARAGAVPPRASSRPAG